MRRHTILGALLVICFSLSKAQRIAHQYIIERRAESSISFGKNENAVNNYKVLGTIQLGNTELDLIEFPKNLQSSDEIRLLAQSPNILGFQINSTLTSRSCNPNDPLFATQWSMEKIGANEVWCFGNSGLSPEGDTIAIGVVDLGFNINEDDLFLNLFHNYGEIPDNMKDDDANGYVDDYTGYSARAGIGDDHPIMSHGTQVLSTIGARGDNKVKLTGVMQKVKLVPCSANTSFDMMDCYVYFMQLRKQYMRSNGKKGGFVVGTNISVGIPDAFPTEYSLLCGIYDSVGINGILNSCATINDPYDIAVAGDIPGLCPSPYLITVTNTNSQDRKVTAAGYNKVHVDMGAPGEDIPGINSSGNVEPVSGCSFSSPHVAATVGLLYQFCPKLTTLAKNQPDSAARLVRKLIETCSDKLVDLTGITATGSRLNVYKAFNCLMEYCGVTSPERIAELHYTLSQGKLQVDYHPTRIEAADVGIFNVTGQVVLKSIIPANPNGASNIILDISYLPQGLYIFTLNDSDGKKSIKFIKI